MRTINVIGTGPAGLIAAHSAQVSDPDAIVHLYGPTTRETIVGAAWLDQPVPYVAEVPSRHIQTSVLSHDRVFDRAGYLEKMTETELPSGGVEELDDWREPFTAYDLRETYMALFAFYSGSIVAWSINADSMRDLTEHVEADIWINSVDARLTCDRGCTFAGVEVWQSHSESHHDRIRLCADDTTSWVRDVEVYGRTLEWSSNRRPPFGAPTSHVRPLWNNCPCHRDVLRVDRAAWNASASVHDVYDRVRAAVLGHLDWRIEIPHVDPACPFNPSSNILPDTAAQMGCRCEG